MSKLIESKVESGAKWKQTWKTSELDEVKQKDILENANF